MQLAARRMSINNVPLQNLQTMASNVAMVGSAVHLALPGLSTHSPTLKQYAAVRLVGEAQLATSWIFAEILMWARTCAKMVGRALLKTPWPVFLASAEVQALVVKTAKYLCANTVEGIKGSVPFNNCRAKTGQQVPVKRGVATRKATTLMVSYAAA